MRKIDDIDILEKIIIGRVDPHIYAFTTNTVPNYLKIGDTYRPVSKRLNEWRKSFPDLEKQYEEKAKVSEDVYFRDYSIHHYLEKDLNKLRLTKDDLKAGEYFSNEFFKDTTSNDIDNAILDIKQNFDDNSGKYDYYDVADTQSKEFHYSRGDDWSLRPNQQESVNNFVTAVNNGRTNLLMYAVMRFGKSFTSLCCALEINAALVVVLSAKADVKDEWKKTVELAGNFKDYKFIESVDLERNPTILDDNKANNIKNVLFLTLQDLQGDFIKEKHQALFKQSIDLLIVDETHFGARAESFGKILKESGYNTTDNKNISKLEDDVYSTELANEEIKKLNAGIKLHLSGTPYRILMGSEFEKEDIISFVQFTDIVKEQENWDNEHLADDEINEWDNPYYGFPQMIRFAFQPSKSAREKMESLKRQGISYAFSKLFEPKSIKKDTKNNLHNQFVNEQEIMDLLQVIDGSKQDEELLGFLDYDKIKEGKMCRHIVMVLPYCASCDAMEQLILSRKDEFKNLNQYQIVNISGVDASKEYKTPIDIKNKIKHYESINQKTITLTVNRMLTGSTVEQWDTMMYFKDTASPQEYDQAIFRLQNQYVRTLHSEEGVIKENLKPQTLLVDFDPNRLFRMQEQKSLIYNVNTDENGNRKLKERLSEELRISPVIMMNHNKIKQVSATNILEAISQYNNNRSITDEVQDLPVDLSILNDEEIRKTIERQAEFNSKKGLTVEPTQGEEDDLDLEDLNDDNTTTEETTNDESSTNKENYVDDKDDSEIKTLESRIKTYYQRVLFFAFLTKDKVASVDDILNVVDSIDNTRLLQNLSLDKNVLQKMGQVMNPFMRSSLDYKIQNISNLATDENLSPLERAMRSIKKFNRMSESEIITPTSICDEMVELLPKEGLIESINKQEKLLDIASKSGEYSVALYKRLIDKLGFEHHQITDSIYAIPTSSIAYEFTRKFYEILGLNVDNIALHFNAYDLIEVKKENGTVDYEKIKILLTQNKPFNQINLKEEIMKGDEKVEFGAVIGNPPYNENTRDTSDKPIYNYFMDISYILSDYACLITPARFLFNAGKTPKIWNSRILSDSHIEVIKFYQKSSSAFDDIDLKGGVAITVRDENKSVSPIGTFTPFKELNNILRKVINSSNFLPVSDQIYLQNKFNLEKLYFDYPDLIQVIGSNGKEKRLTTSIFSQLPIFNDSKYNENDVQILGLINNQRIFKWINRKYLDNQVNFEKYKIIVPKSNGTGAIGEVLSTPLIGEPLIGEPLIGYTQSFISIFSLNTNEEAEFALKYIKSKFSRALLGTLKITQDNNKETWKNVPLQDFSKESDIDWSKSIHEIDQQLYRKYNLTNEEIQFIESKIQSMDS